MPPQTKPTPKAPGGGVALSEQDAYQPKWTVAELMAVKHLGPGIIGPEMHAASQALVEKTHDGIFGPALLGDPAHAQGGPKLVDGKPVFPSASNS
jgi:hypothetical protein